jgi:hypothetical protein
MLCNLLIQHRYPNAPKTLCNQLGASICRRGSALRYLQLHNEKLAYQRDEHENMDEFISDNVEQESISPALVSDVVVATKMAPSQDTLPSLLSPSAVVRFSQAKHKPTSSIISRGSVVLDEQGNEFRYPPVPKSRADKKFRSCTVCSEPLDCARLTEQDWR